MKAIGSDKTKGGGMGEQDADDALARSALARIARGDEGALEELHSLYAPAVFAFVSARLGDRGAAEEAAVDVWLGCWRSAAAFRGDSRVLTWLLGITKRQVYVRMRRARPVECALDDGTEQLADETGDALEVLLAQAGLDEIVAALDALEPALAETVRLAWLHELPHAEIAQVTDVPVGTVKSRVSRARALLQKTLGRRV